MEKKAFETIINLINKLILKTDLIEFAEKQTDIIEYTVSPFCAVIWIKEDVWKELFDKLQKIYPYFNFKINHCDYLIGKVYFRMRFNPNSNGVKFDNFVRERANLLTPKEKEKIKNLILHFKSKTKKYCIKPVYNRCDHILFHNNNIIASNSLIPSILCYIKYELGFSYESVIDKNYSYIYKYNILSDKLNN